MIKRKQKSWWYCAPVNAHSLHHFNYTLRWCLLVKMVSNIALFLNFQETKLVEKYNFLKMLLTLTNIQESYFSFFRPLGLLVSPARLGRSSSLPFLLLDQSGFRGVTSGAITSPSCWGQITRDIFLMWISFSPGWTDIRIAVDVEFLMCRGNKPTSYSVTFGLENSFLQHHRTNIFLAAFRLLSSVFLQ